ncbi:MAG: 50S ribosomal protein L18 [Anaerolineae bacterium]
MPDLKGKKKYQARKRRQRRVRAKVHGTADRPRLSIFRSNENIFAQVINDESGHTVASASTIDSEIVTQLQDKTKSEAAKIVGQVLANRAKEAGVEVVLFDRGGFQYRGRVAALAEGAREAGLKF